VHLIGVWRMANSVSRKISERKLVLFTVLLLIVAGIVRLISFKVGIVLFYLSFLPLLGHRTIYYVTNRKALKRVDRFRIFIYILMVLTITLNFIGWQNIEFILLFLLAIDYLIITSIKSKH